MTATPIPRTLSLTLYGDLEVSLIDELPPGRKPVETRVVDPAERLGAYEEVRKEIEEGRQAYVICPLVEESEALEDVRAAEELYEELANEIFPEKVVGLLHRMKARDKREVMALFRAGRSRCSWLPLSWRLVSTCRTRVRSLSKAQSVSGSPNSTS